MNENFNIFKLFLGALGCIIVFAIPVLGVLAIWGFDPEVIKEQINNIIPKQDEDSQNYNFEIPAGEDELLTSTIINESKKAKVTPKENPASFLSISSADIEGPIVYGTDGESSLREGFWNHPISVEPGETGVSAIFGHRRYHIPPAKDTFYSLDKVNVGDRIEVRLKDGTWLEYKVTAVDIVKPEKIDSIITKKADKSIIKLITCTPLGTDEKRLVVTAERVL
ncbi:MAG: sortase [Candidatus Dojkabacteria bacterium]|nr:sortase [Candidatus Dojkabacteria bacterium]